MAVERQQSGTSLIDVLDRVLDKGIVIDAWVRVSVVGIDLITVEARVVVASIETYLRYSEAVSTATSAARPPLESRPSYDELEAENTALRAQIAGPADGHVDAGGDESSPGRKRPRRRRGSNR
jgi:gas vesicle structural protein